jgi:hypothetical protein
MRPGRKSGVGRPHLREVVPIGSPCEQRRTCWGSERLHFAPGPQPFLTGRAIRVPHPRVHPGTQRTTTVTSTPPTSWSSSPDQQERIPRICLIRMRSQVQVLAGPPPIVAGQSAAGTEPGALAAGLGRAGAARPSPPAPPMAPPGPPTRASGSATTTHRGRAPSRGRQPRGGCSHLALQPAPVPTAQPPARGSARRPGLPGRSVVKRGRRGPHPTRRPGSATDLSLTNATAAASPASRPPGPSIEPSTARQPQGRHRFRWSRSPGHLLRWEDTDASGRTGQTADGWTPHGWTAAGRPPDPLDDDPR